MSKIINLQVENFQILKALEISPTGNIVTIGGDNDQGKSSLLKAIWVALVGRSVAGAMPIRKGEEKCIIRVETEELIVTRTFTAKDGGEFTDTIKVESSDGRTRFQKPQQVLNELMGQIGFDPFEFVLRKPEDQAEILLQMVPLAIDLEALAADDFTDFANRRDINRDVAGLAAQIAAIPIDPDLPTEPIDRQAIISQLSNAADTNTAIERDRMARESRAQTIAQRKEDAVAKRDEADRLLARIQELREEAGQLEAGTAEREAELLNLPPLADLVDTAKLREELAAAESTNAKIADAQRRAELVKSHAAKAAQAQGLTDLMEAREEDRRKALSSAKMPIEGLSFAINNKGKPVVMYRDVPFSEASSAIQIRASTAIAMAAHPELRVMRIKDGSLLDSKSLAIIAEMAEANDWQIWIERVGDGGVGFIIEDGSVKGQRTIEAAPKAEKAKAAPADKLL